MRTWLSWGCRTTRAPTHGPGPGSGPNGIRYVNRIYDYMDAFEDKEAQGYFDIDRKEMMLRNVTMVDCGDVTIIPSDVENNYAKTTHAVRQILARGAFPVIVGGDHSITFPAVRGFDSYGRPGRGPLRCAHRLQP